MIRGDSSLEMAAITVDALADLLRNCREGVKVVDCRREEELAGGKIRGAIVLRGQQSLDELVAGTVASASVAGTSASVVVFYCLAGSAESTKCAARFVRQVRSKREGTGPEGKVLEGGAFAFIKQHHADPLLVEDFNNDK